MRLIFIFLAFSFCGTYGGQDTATLKVAVIDLKKVAADSMAGKSIDEQISEINDKAREDLVEIENSIKKMDSSQKGGLEERKVEDLQVILYDMTRKKRYQIQNAYKTAVKILEKNIFEVVKSIADEKKLSLVVVSDAVFYRADSSEDITSDVICRLDTVIKRIPVKLEEQERPLAGSNR